MCSLRPFITKLIASLPPPPAGHDALNDLVEKTLAEAKPNASLESWKHQWEYLLKDEVLKLALKEGKALKENREAYYEELRDMLDLVLLFSEHDATEQNFPALVLQDLLETQTIESCSQVFSWIEDRAARLTKGLVPQKGKALVLLRALNDLLKRLSRMGSTTLFCGRILTFLSAVFPLGERSGVNLRGEYGPTWEGVHLDLSEGDKDELAEREGGDVLMASASGSSSQNKDKMDVDERTEMTEAERKADFYNTFWSLQLFFSKPSTFATEGSMEEFKTSISKVMPVIKEATAKERAMMGSRNLTGTAASLKRKREPEPEAEETNLNEYFFAKFLTSPELLDLEIADTHFRRQFLLQVLILLQHLLNYTAERKLVWQTYRNKSLHMDDFTLQTSDAQWVQDAMNKVFEELKQTAPNGRQFAETVATILDREKNWVKWKSELCPSFDKEPWTDAAGQKIGLWEATKDARLALDKDPESWPYALGSASLTEVWEMGYRDLTSLETSQNYGDVKDFVKRIKQTDLRIEARRKQLAKQAERIAEAKARRTAQQQQAEKTEASSNEQVSAAAASQTASTASKPLSSSGSAPLHPSLPPKPGTPIKSSQEASKPPPSGVPTIVEPQPTAPLAAPPVEEKKEPPAALLTDPQIQRFEEDKQRLTWLGLRPARDQYLQHFGRIGTGDLEALLAVIEEEKKKGMKEEVAATPEENTEPVGSVESSEDVKMEG